MWKRRNGSRVIISSKSSDTSSRSGDVSSTTSNEDFDSYEEDDVIGVMGSRVVSAKSPQVQFRNNEERTANMKETIKYLRHQLDVATDRIAAFVVEKGDLEIKGTIPDGANPDAVNDAVNRKLRDVQFKSSLETALRNVTAQSLVMLAERRDIQADLENTKALTAFAEAKMENMLAASIVQRTEILSKLKAIQKLIVFEERKESRDDVDYERDYNTDDAVANFEKFTCLPPIFYCWRKPAIISEPTLSTSSSEKERYIQFSDYEIINEMRHLHNLLYRKIQEYNSNATLDAAEISMLKTVINENNQKLAKRGLEIEILRKELEESRTQAAHIATQHGELNAFFAKVKVKLQNDIAETEEKAAAAELAAEREAEKHIQEKAELRSEFQNAIMSLENMIRTNAVEASQETVTDEESPRGDTTDPIDDADNNDENEDEE